MPNATDNIWDKFDPEAHQIDKFNQSLSAREESVHTLYKILTSVNNIQLGIGE